MKYFKDEGGKVFSYSDIQNPALGLFEMTEDEVYAYFNPPPYMPTYQEELALLNNQYQVDVEAFNKAFSLAILFDGVSEEAKKAAIREQYTTRKQKYVADITALKLKHGV